jgi:hypothetical protein
MPKRTQEFMVAPQVASNGVIVRAPATGGVTVRNTQGYNSVELIINLATVDKETPGKTLAVGLYRIVGGVDTFVAGFPSNNLGNFPGSTAWISHNGTWTITTPDGTRVTDPDPSFMVNIAQLFGQQVCIKYFATGLSTIGLTVNGIG